MEKNELKKLNEETKKQYDELCKQGLKLDMSRGKPSPAQLDLSLDMLTHCLDGDYMSETGVDCRNYGVLDGIEEAKRLCMPMLGVAHDEIIIGGNSSLQLMYDTMARAMLLGVLGGDKPWGKNEKVKFLCPAPGYDRHFAICQSLGIEMITVPYTPDGPDMDVVEKLVSEDELIKGIWCVPKYSNPMGVSYSDETVRRIAALRPRAKDFRVFWDNAYVLHDLTDTPDEVLEIFSEARKYGNEDMFFEFASTSKITYPGSGISCIAASPRNIERILAAMKIQTIGHDKMNQLRHSKVFRCYDDIVSQMRVHMNIIRPKFQAVYDAFEREFAGMHGVHWTKPNGGYFITLVLPNGTAKRTVELCRDIGLIITPAGAMFPYGVDPNDNMLRIAPTYPSLSEIARAAEVLACCARLAIAENGAE